VAPFGRYGALPEALSRFGKDSKRLPLDILVVEGFAPDAVRARLEGQALHSRNIRILYAHRVPTLAEAYNLALPHIRTPYVFFTIGELEVTRAAITAVLDHVKHYGLDAASPQIPDIDQGRMPASIWSDRLMPHTAGDLRAVLFRKDALTAIGGFDEQMDFVLAGVDAAAGLARRQGKTARLPMVLPYAAHGARRLDPPLQEVHWNLAAAERSVDRYIQKHGRTLSKTDYLGWTRWAAETVGRKPLPALAGLHLPPNFAKVLTRRLSHSLDILRMPTRSY
jgi:hypothetical protein